MSRHFGPIRQNGYVVEDLDAALRHWTEVLGIGPFFKIPHIPLDFYEYRGSRVDLDLSIAIGNSGDLQIELIQQHNDAPSPYRDHLLARGPGLQHVSGWSEDYEADIARLAGLGYRPAAQGKIRGAARFIYYDTDGAPGGHPGSMMELSDLRPGRALLQAVRDAAIGWDGRDPVRLIAM
ncbi:VOC family protein [Zavarzinia sp. CC-PAN008]|uniref:VOC family protein n=1 Tax=Zavarzinia sp. CC-PAN008 TaxID=3243332 RepID=UPI003F745459